VFWGRYQNRYQNGYQKLKISRRFSGFRLKINQYFLGWGRAKILYFPEG